MLINHSSVQLIFHLTNSIITYICTFSTNSPAILTPHFQREKKKNISEGRSNTGQNSRKNSCCLEWLLDGAQKLLDLLTLKRLLNFTLLVSPMKHQYLRSQSSLTTNHTSKLLSQWWYPGAMQDPELSFSLLPPQIFPVSIVLFPPAVYSKWR